MSRSTSSTLNDIRKELHQKSAQDLLTYCLRLAKYKKENKELLGYLLFEAGDEAGFVQMVIQEMEDLFEGINLSSIYFIKKSVRKTLRIVNKYIRFAGSKTVEAELLIHFCNCMITRNIPLHKSRQLASIYDSQIKKINAALLTLHPDLQFDLGKKLLRSRQV